MTHNMNYLAIFEFVMNPGHCSSAANGLPGAQALCFVADCDNQYEHLEAIRSRLESTVLPYATCRVHSCERFGDYLS